MRNMSLSHSPRTRNRFTSRCVMMAAALILPSGIQAWASSACMNVPNSWVAPSQFNHNQARVRWFEQCCLYPRARERNMPDDPANTHSIRIVLADDHDILRQGLKLLL